MIIDYIHKISKQIQSESNMRSKIDIVESICSQKVLDKFKKANLSFVMSFLTSKDVKNETKILLAYFCAIARHVEEGYAAISNMILQKFFMVPFCEGQNHYVDPYSAYLGIKICEELIIWQEQEKIDCIVEYHFLFTKATLTEFLDYLTQAEKRSELIACHKKMYDISDNLPKDLQSRIYHNYGHALYIIFFTNDAYVDYPEKADILFEKAIKLRTKTSPNEQQLKSEVLSKTTYAAHLRQQRQLKKAEDILKGLLEKLETNCSCYSNAENYYYDYAQCLNNIINIEEEKYSNNQENRLRYYLDKFQSFLTEIIDKGKQIQSDAIRVLASNMMMRDIVSNADKKQMFEKLMPKCFWDARTEKNLNNEETCRYKFFFDMIDMLYLFFEGSSIQEKFVLSLHFVEKQYFEEHPGFFKIDKYELLLVGNYALSTLENEELGNKELENDGIYYAIFFLTLFPLAINQGFELKNSYYRLVQIIISKCSTKRNEIANILYYMQKLPWYKQQLRILKSHEFDLLLKQFLELEINIYENPVNNEELYNNILSAWDNLTLTMTRVAKRMLPFYIPPHPIHHWGIALNEFATIQKLRTEFGGNAEYKMFEEHLRQEAQNFIKHQKNKTVLVDLELDNSTEELHLQEQRLFQKVLQDKQIQEKYDFTFFIDSPFAIQPNISLSYLVSVLKKNRIICMTTLVKSVKKNSSCLQEKEKLLSTIIQYQNNEISVKNKITEISVQEYQSFSEIVYTLEVKNVTTIAKHFIDLFAEIKDKSKQNLIWIGTDFLKFFPIHILPYRKNSTWIDVWKSIVFCPSLREAYLPIKGDIGYDPYNKKQISILRCLGEKSTSDKALIGNTIFEELANTENHPCVYSEDFLNPNSEKTYEESTPKVFSYYGHITYGHPFDPNTGFISNNKKSMLNNIMNMTSNFANTQRVELWGCQSSKSTPFHSKELSEYQYFSGYFLDIAEQVIATLKEVPDITTALICEHFSLSEKCSQNTEVGVLLKQSILWYRSVIKNVREKIEKSFHSWACEHNAKSRLEKQHSYLRREITALLNQERKSFHATLSGKFDMRDFTEEVVDRGILTMGEACYLGRKKKEEKAWSDSDSKEIIKKIFDELEHTKSWGGIILTETAFSE